jgi:hypothetical protein
METATDKLEQIQPGVNYPTSVNITEKVGDRSFTLSLNLYSYRVGMYCAIYQDGHCINQTGDHDNRRFVRDLKGDIGHAIKRGAVVEIGAIRPVQQQE